TRSKRDWSSDVCSSDLERVGGVRLIDVQGPLDGGHLAAQAVVVDAGAAAGHLGGGQAGQYGGDGTGGGGVADAHFAYPEQADARSEERRVGKRCGARVS